MNEEFAQDPRQVLGVVERIAKPWPADSPEYAALEHAAKAILFAYGEAVRERFRQFLGELDTPLTPEQIARLRALGIDVE